MLISIKKVQFNSITSFFNYLKLRSSENVQNHSLSYTTLSHIRFINFNLANILRFKLSWRTQIILPLQRDPLTFFSFFSIKLTELTATLLASRLKSLHTTAFYLALYYTRLCIVTAPSTVYYIWLRLWA